MDPSAQSAWFDLWHRLEEDGIKHSPAGIEAISIPLSAVNKVIQSPDGTQTIGVLVGLLIPLGEWVPPVSSNDLLDPILADRDGSWFNDLLAFLHKKYQYEIRNYREGLGWH